MPLINFTYREPISDAQAENFAHLMPETVTAILGGDPAEVGVQGDRPLITVNMPPLSLLLRYGRFVLNTLAGPGVPQLAKMPIPAEKMIEARADLAGLRALYVHERMVQGVSWALFESGIAIPRHDLKPLVTCEPVNWHLGEVA